MVSLLLLLVTVVVGAVVGVVSQQCGVSGWVTVAGWLAELMCV